MTAENMRKTALVVPCYNEAERLAPEKFLDKLPLNPNLVFIFVDDGSVDGTEGIITGMVSSRPENFRLVSLKQNRGKGEAVRLGMLTAVRENFGFTGFWDADLATPLSEIGAFQRLMENEMTDVVIGSRIKLMGRDIQRKATRHYLGRIFATSASLALNLPVYDTQCGAKLFRNTQAFRQSIAEPFIVGWIFDVELLARLELAERELNRRSLRQTMIESPLMKWKDAQGSKIKPRHYIRAVWDMAKLIVRYTPGLYNGAYVSARGPEKNEQAHNGK